MIGIYGYKHRIERYKDRYVEAYRRGLDNISDWLTSGPGDQYTHNRKMLADKCIELSGIPYWHFVNCASDALQASIVALTKPGDKIITAATSFIAVPQSIVWVNRNPVFCDIGNDGLACIESVKKAVHEHPDAAAILVVHMFGRAQNVYAIREVIPPHMKIIEDVAQSFYMPGDNREKPGTYSDVVCYSFDVSKSPGSTGSGGAVASHDPVLLNQIRESTQQGFDITRTNYISPAMKSSIDDTTACVVLEDIKIIEETNSRQIRKNNHTMFEKEIKRRQFEGENFNCVMFCFYPENLSTVEARKLLRDNGIQSYSFNPVYPDIEAFSSYDNVGYSNAKRIAETHLRIPCHEFLNEQEKSLIVDLANKT
jgi:dTDP-4-amino-4,6-dideoxygalactose transaminase